MTTTISQPQSSGVLSALLNAMREIAYVVKDADARSGGASFPAVSIEGVLSEVRPVLIKHGLLIVPIKVDITSSERYQSRGGAEMNHVRLVMTYNLSHPESNTGINLQSPGECADVADKASGKAMTMALKWLLRQMLLLITGVDDPDLVNSDQLQRIGAKPTYQTPLYHKILMAIQSAQSQDVLKKILTAAKVELDQGRLAEVAFQELVALAKQQGTEVGGVKA